MRKEPGRFRFLHDRRTVSEAGLVGVMLLLATAEIVLTTGLYSVRAHLAPALVGAAAMCGALWWRRSRPLIPVIVVLAVLSAAAVLGVPPQAWLVPLLCLVAYSVGAYARGWVSGIGLGGSVLAGCVIANSAVDGPPALVDYVWTVAMLGVSWAAGLGMRRSQRAAAEEREDALAEQRTRIARELHDIVAHSLTVVVMNADAAEMALDRDPRLAAEPVRSIRRVAQDAMADMRRLVGILRIDGADSREPPPSLSRLNSLVETVRDSGMPVNVSVEGDLGALPAGVDLAAYRVVQEALTNARRHSTPGSQAWVRVRRDTGLLRLEVVNDGEPLPATVGSGNGLTGLRERVALYRGAFDAAPLPEGGFRVAASLPLSGPSP